MKTGIIGVIVALSLISSPGFTEPQIPPVSLSPFPGATTMAVEKAALVSGKCGASVVRIIGITLSTGAFFDIDQDGGVIVRQLHMPEVHLTQNNGLSDHNGVACIHTAAGASHLLIWSACGGSACGDDFGFTVIEVDRPRIVSPKDCNKACASKLTGGSNIPFVLNGRRPG